MRELLLQPFVGEILMFGVASALALVAYLVCMVPMAQAPEHGARGLAREEARKAGFFRASEPGLRLLAGHVARFSIGKERTQIDSALTSAGELRGLTPDEFIVLSAFSWICASAVGLYFLSAETNLLVPLACFVLGPFLPWLHLQSIIKARHKSVQRGLPGAIDLASLCMGAGLDFPGALRHVVDNMPEGPSPVRDELSRLLQELQLGRTRKQALQAFAIRVNTEAVREFVAAVVQSEDKGTPLSEILAIQAEVLRSRRSVLAEEAAARAGVMLMLPMIMMVISIMLLLMGPLFIDMAKGQML